MLEWKPFELKEDPPDGQYIVFCTAPNFDSEWVDIARFDNGIWHAFRTEVSSHNRVRQYAEINKPEE